MTKVIQDKKLVDYIDVTPTPNEYRKLLMHIIGYSTKKEDVEWASQEYKRVAFIKEWGTTRDFSPSLKVEKE